MSDANTHTTIDPIGDKINEITSGISGVSVEESESEWQDRRRALANGEPEEMRYIHSCFGVGSPAGLLRKSWRISKPVQTKINQRKPSGKDDMSLFIRRYGFQEGSDPKDTTANDWVITWVPAPIGYQGKKADGTKQEPRKQLAYVLNPDKWGPLLGAIPATDPNPREEFPF